MYPHAGTTRSLWQNRTHLQHGARLRGDITTDVVIVGGGIAGLTSAWLLRQRGIDVVVLEDGRLGSGETERTTAHLTSVLDDRFVELEKMHGADNTGVAAQSHAQAIDQIETIVDQLQVDCGFRRVHGYLFAADVDGNALLDEEYAAAVRAGLEVAIVDEVPGVQRLGRALRFSNQAEFEPLPYLTALAEACIGAGVRIFTGAHVSDLEGGAAPRATTEDGHTVAATRAVVVCTNTPVNDLLAVHTKQIPYRTYVVGLRVAAGALPSALWWDTSEPYHYVRVVKARPDTVGDDAFDVLLVGGEDHRVSAVHDADERFDRLEAWAKERFPCGARVNAWSGQVMEPADGLAFIGKNPMDADNVYIATGDAGQGITHGTIAGMMFAELLAPKRHAHGGRCDEANDGVDAEEDALDGNLEPWTRLYDPGRVSAKAIGEYTKDGINAVAQYARWLKGSDVDGDANIPRGSGAIQRRGLSLVAVYVDPAGEQHACSAVCPHLGAILAWNDLEKSWDCPLHGSRFTTSGIVMNGPANVSLNRLDEDGKEIAGHAPFADSSEPVAIFADRK
jgi:glycine/D-amino acid oxidase-like deaminating enzyme/nitrite reductase/ring-hydroxylating ferredoxin subunit